jgi:glutaredoxin 3
MSAVTMYSTRVCPYCRMAEALLARKGVQARKIMVDEDMAQLEEMRRRTGRKTVPQIYIGERHVGGYMELAELDHRGELEPLLAAP